MQRMPVPPGDQAVHRISLSVSQAVARENLAALPKDCGALVAVGSAGNTKMRSMTVREALELMASIPEGRTVYSESHRSGAPSATYEVQIRTQVVPGVPYHLGIRAVADATDNP